MYLLYKLPVAVVPPNRPMARIDHPLELYWSQDDKFQVAPGPRQSAPRTDADESALPALQKLLYRIGLSWKKGRPVLIGTESIEESDAVAAFLRKVAPFLKFQVLNARPEFLRQVSPPRFFLHSCQGTLSLTGPFTFMQESEIIAQAGLPQAVTVSTNMAGRGTDIKLGGDPRGLAKAALARSLLPELVQVIACPSESVVASCRAQV